MTPRNEEARLTLVLAAIEWAEGHKIKRTKFGNMSDEDFALFVAVLNYDAISQGREPTGITPSRLAREALPGKPAPRKVPKRKQRSGRSGKE